MAYIPGCRHDVFVSYAGENNSDGWVLQFAEALQRQLEVELGRYFPSRSVFLDSKNLRVGQCFPAELQECARDSAFLVPVLSPSYLTSHWCNYERQAFFQRLSQGAQPCECLAPIVVRSVPIDHLPMLYRDAHRIDFIRSDGEPWPANSNEWWDRVRALARQLKSALQEMRRKYRPVFLGGVPPEFSLMRERLMAELISLSLRIVPETLLILDEPSELENHLNGATLAVHFVGVGAMGRAARLEAIELSAKYCAANTIIYQPFGSSLDPTERFFLRELRPQPTQFLTNKNERALLETVRDQLSHVSCSAPKPPASVGLVCDVADFDLARTIQAAVKTYDKIHVEYPAFLQISMTGMELLRRWQEHLSMSRALLFCWGRSEIAKLENLEEMALTHYRRWYITNPDFDQKIQSKPDAIQQPGEFDYRRLSEFLDPLRRQEQAT